MMIVSPIKLMVVDISICNNNVSVLFKLFYILTKHCFSGCGRLNRDKHNRHKESIQCEKNLSRAFEFTLCGKAMNFISKLQIER